MNKKLSYRKETMQLLLVSVLAKYNLKTIFLRHYKSLFSTIVYLAITSLFRPL